MPWYLLWCCSCQTDKRHGRVCRVAPFCVPASASHECKKGRCYGAHLGLISHRAYLTPEGDKREHALKFRYDLWEFPAQNSPGPTAQCLWYFLVDSLQQLGTELSSAPKTYHGRLGFLPTSMLYACWSMAWPCSVRDRSKQQGRQKPHWLEAESEQSNPGRPESSTQSQPAALTLPEQPIVMKWLQDEARKPVHRSRFRWARYKAVHRHGCVTAEAQLCQGWVQEAQLPLTEREGPLLRLLRRVLSN